MVEVLLPNLDIPGVLPPTTTMTSQPAPPISLFDDDDTRWQAVRDRDANADGFFVYGVRSTRIYCRPICKARLARRANVSFYDTPHGAREAGFRACKRCKPEMEGFMPEDAAVRKIRAFVSSGGGDGVMSLGQMARRTGLSKWHFHRVFKKCVGVTPVEYVRMRRRSGDLASSVGQTDVSTTSAGSESPATSLDADWLQQLEMGEFDFGVLDPALADSGTASMGGMVDGDMSWADLLIWPEDDLTGPT